MSLRQQLIDTKLFAETDTRDLVFEDVRNEVQDGVPITTAYVARLKFDSFGGLIDVKVSAYNPTYKQIMAANRRGLGLPPQHSKG